MTMPQPFSDKTTVAIPADVPRAERLAAVLDRYMRELETGGIPPDIDQLVAEHPDLADELRSYADSLKLLHQMTAGLRPLPTRAEPPPAGMVAKRLGDYDIVREIGRGGMGIVYEARQLSLNRQVALKVLPFAAMLDEKQIARFRNEALAAAQLHHPNIVPVHAVGQERGVHFFAMQYVPGQSLEAALEELRRQPITPFDDGEPAPANAALRDTAGLAGFSTRASTRSRGYCQSVARLMIQAADAIQHAHEYGVIHRDVKPSNLLLDRDGKLWVTDFGLARMQSDSGVTITGDVVGTLRYMSPEQAAGATGLVDARADVYALGATLYELLTLRPAHSGENRQEVLRHIETREPTPPRQLNGAIPLDLETITLRAMAKARDERYRSAAELAADLRSFLEGRPTLAQRPTMLDRAGKWALRHRAAVSVAAAVLLVITTISVAAAVLIARERSRTVEKNNELVVALAEKQAALKQEDLARRNAEQSYRTAREAVDRIYARATQLRSILVAMPQTSEMFREALAYYRQFRLDNAHDPLLRRDLADASFKAASISDLLGNRREAVDLCRQALAEYDALVKESPDDLPLAIERAKCWGSLGMLLYRAGKVDAALDAYAAAIAEQRALVNRGGAQPDPAAVATLADAHSNLGLLLAEVDRKGAARRSLQAGIALTEQLVAADPDNLDLRHDLAVSYNSLSFVEREIDWARAEESCRRAIGLLETVVAERDDVPSYRADLALCRNNFGAILAHRGDWSAACDSYRQAIALQEQLQRIAPAVVGYRRELAVSWNNLGQALDARGRAVEAADAYNAAEEIVAALVEDYPDELEFRSLYGAVLNNRGMALEASGRRDEARAAFEQAIAEQRTAYERAPQVAAFRDNLSKHYYNFGRALRDAGDPARAGEMALARRALWAGDGEHLGQIAIELAQAAVQARSMHREDHAKDDAELAAHLEAEAAATVRDAAAAGCDLARLRAEPAFQLLQNPTILAMIHPAPTTTD
jgi:serine/threonine protein kinase/tetratricopeptide (TPR) repeat protein